MTLTTPADSALRMPPAKRRILDAATRLFANEGIRAVGVDRLIQESSVTKATFYKHFGSKDRLIQDYLRAASARALASLDDGIRAATTAEEGLAVLTNEVTATLQSEFFRGSLFVNAAAEFPDPADPVRHIIAHHHEAIAARVTELLQQTGHTLAGEAADQIMVAYVGALSWGHVGDPIGAGIAFRRAVERVVREPSAAA